MTKGGEVGQIQRVRGGGEVVGFGTSEGELSPPPPPPYGFLFLSSTWC